MTLQATKFTYTPKYKPKQLICGTGQTAIITGWTVKQFVAKHLEPHEFAVIGQLYSPTRGISLLLRNLLANPHARFLTVVNATKEDRNAGGCDCLLDFFRTNYVRGDLMSLLTQYILFAGLVYFTISMLATYAVKRLQRRLSV